MNYGEYINRVRKSKKITLKELSRMTELSVSFLSQVERGVSSTTVTSLKKISDALGIEMSELFSFAEEESSFVRTKENQMHLKLIETYTSHTKLSGRFENRKLEALLYYLAPGSGRAEKFAHEGEEFHYVLKGTAEFILEDKKYVVKAGDSLHFPSTIPHSVNNNTKEGLEILSVLTPRIF